MTDKEKLIQRIKDVICAGERIPEADLSLKTTDRKTIGAKQKMSYFMWEMELASKSEIGLHFGIDRTTVHTSIIAVKNHIETEPLYRELMLKYRIEILKAPEKAISIEDQNKSLIEENTALKAQIKLLEDEVFLLQSRLQQVRPAKGESIRPYMGYVPAFR